MLFDEVFGYREGSDLVCHARTGPVSFAKFRRRLAATSAALRARLVRLPSARVALYCDDSYEFSLLLFAALACGAQVVIPANNKRSTMEHIGDVSLWLGNWEICSPERDIRAPEALLPEHKDSAELCEFSGSIQLFTSGSSGEPQRVNKTLTQLLTEIETQQQLWGALAERTTTLATVSHQHIYGLLFKVLWPLYSGRPFVGKTYRDVAALLRDAKQFAPALWIASPAQLSRRIDSWPWYLGHSLHGIFSSGGPLAPEDARAVEELSGKAPLEIYGSTETGGIAWRQQIEDARWQPLARVQVSADSDDLLRVNSPWLPEVFSGQDRIKVDVDGRFRLLGRADRIVKIEEKRVSLSQVESLLMTSEWIVDARTLTVKRGRQGLAAVVALSASGREILMLRGRGQLVRALRALLAPDLDGVALPRLWRFVDAIPKNQQGKSPRELLMQLFDATPVRMLPRVIKREMAEQNVRVEIQIPADLPCLPGHFEDAPVVPGVVQIDWAMHYGRELLGLGGRFSSMEVIKFKQLLRPGENAVLELEFDIEKNKLKFRFHCPDNEVGEYSSGKLCFDHG
ncbi:AMP-binding protein [Microbulbifer litoralis]|uniref:AMP-binding protein n=1 Tax=Microbulbifer litoralis TaxID=2933965 RepID=UPI0020291F61|nr:AMP-binding protein [Microbulbifer sp. GX H0434]